MLFLPLTGVPINSVQHPEPISNPPHPQASSHHKQDFPLGNAQVLLPPHSPPSKELCTPLVNSYQALLNKSMEKAAVATHWSSDTGITQQWFFTFGVMSPSENPKAAWTMISPKENIIKIHKPNIWCSLRLFTGALNPLRLPIKNRRATGEIGESSIFS